MFSQFCHFLTKRTVAWDVFGFLTSKFSMQKVFFKLRGGKEKMFSLIFTSFFLEILDSFTENYYFGGPSNVQ